MFWYSVIGSGDVEKLKKLVLHNPFILTLPEVGDIKDEFIPKNVQQFWVRFSLPISENYGNYHAFLRIPLWPCTYILQQENDITCMT